MYKHILLIAIATCTLSIHSGDSDKNSTQHRSKKKNTTTHPNTTEHPRWPGSQPVRNPMEILKSMAFVNKR